jgi:hypothetical protein
MKQMNTAALHRNAIAQRFLVVISSRTLALAF